jgi:hypothetical protein
MKLFSIALFFTVLLGYSFFKENSEDGPKGVYVISVTSPGKKPFRFPDDSLFIYKGAAVEQILRVDQTFLDNNKSVIKESLDTYYFIDFKKGLFRDMGKNLNRKDEKAQWLPMKDKKSGFDFTIPWYADEKYKIKDTIYNGKKIKKIQYQNVKGMRYTVLMRMNSSKEQFPVIFPGIEDRFKADVIKMFVTYPGQHGSWVYTKKFIPLKNHEVFKALDSKKSF